MNALRVLVLALALTFAFVCRLHTKLGSPKKEREEENVITLCEKEEEREGWQMGTEFKAIRIRRSKVTCVCMYSYMPHMSLNVAIF